MRRNSFDHTVVNLITVLCVVLFVLLIIVVAGMVITVLFPGGEGQGDTLTLSCHPVEGSVYWLCTAQGAWEHE